MRSICWFSSLLFRGLYFLKALFLVCILFFSFLSRSHSQEAAQPECIQYDASLPQFDRKRNSRVEKSPFEALEGKKIRKINFRQMTIFDENNPDENNKIYLFLNSLHVKTRSSVVKSQLLFAEGDRIDPKLMDETARILRTRKYLTNADVLPETLCGDEVDIIVITQDAWAIEPQVSYSHDSISDQTGFAINDGNILGSGNSLTVGYRENQLRNTVFYKFENPYFLNRQVALEFLYEDTTDGHNGSLNVSHPFYALDTPWASGLSISRLSQVEEIRAYDKVINDFRHEAIDNEIYVGKATEIHERFTQRWLLGLAEEEDSFFTVEDTLQPIPSHDKAVYPWIEYQYLENNFSIYRNLNQIQRPEDIAFGQTAALRLGFAGTSFGNSDDVVRYKSEYANNMRFSDRHIVMFHTLLDGREHLQIKGLDPAQLVTSVAYHYLMNERNRWYASFEYGVSEDIPQYKEFTVGAITGLRGYPVDYLRGKKRYVFTLERRYFSDIHLFNLVRLGGVIFFDRGKAWGLDNQPEAPMLSDIGIGLRFSSTKVRIGNVVHVNIAVPTSAKTGLSKYQITLGAEKQF